MTIYGTYFQGKISLDSTPPSSRPLKVQVVFEDETPSASLKLSDFSFAKTQELLKDVKESFSEELIKERREP